MNTFSVIVPVYNSEHTLKPLTERLVAVFNNLRSEFEIIFVNDCSNDNSLQVLKEIRTIFGKNIIIVDLYRNFGQQNALMCGFQFCSGNFVVTIDDDLQNPPEEIPLLVEKINQGYDAVFGCYEKKKDKFHKNLGSRILRKLNHAIFNVKGDLRFSSYRIIKKDIIDQIKSLRTPYPYISGMILETTSKVTNQIIKHEARQHGKSGYSLKKLVNLSFNLLINYSSIPLKIFGYLGLFVSVISLIISGVFVIKQLFLGNAPAGWTSLIVLISFYNTLILILFFVFGEYIKRILREISNYRPYIIKDVIK
ncbi:MAG: glycosyltransferase family 2 protein [Bacteroidales bacterium]|nr:glycosyltransferase family 2 protein [Bacteroidales bacterium]HOY37851.1 glycosyltransferase family 2 protein [Bacteroidales bacterium]HQP04397.1 glycosyltransferase family 2 protein [Bacteroidales bacterium]